MLINEENIEKAKKIIKNTKEKPIIVMAKDNLFNRKILEFGKFDILLSVEKEREKDSLRQIDSGLNHVLAKIALEKNVAIGIDINEISKLGKKEKAIRLSKIIQNIKICRKAKTKTIGINFKDKRNAFSFFISLGASTKQAQEAVQNSIHL